MRSASAVPRALATIEARPSSFPSMPDPIDPDRPHPWLGGLTPRRFLRRHWQRRPLLVRGALAGVPPPLSRPALFDLAGREDVESRLVRRERRGTDAARWSVRHGPIPRRSLPPLARPDWTLLVQGVDLHDDTAHALLAPFRFTPDARLDDLMISYATDGGGVGPHVDSYDVFLLQVQGRRRWRVAPPGDATLVDGLPLKILARFEPEHDWVCEPGDLLYIPPGWGHDGVAVGGDCMTCSVGYRAPGVDALAVDLLQRLLDAHERPDVDRLYRDAGIEPTATPAAMPAALQAFARDAVLRWLGRPAALERALRTALGEVMTEPKPGVWFDPDRAPADDGGAVRLDRRSRMLHDDGAVYLNGEAWRVGGRDATLLRRLADRRELSAADRSRLGADAAEALADWIAQGWVVPATRS